MSAAPSRWLFRQAHSLGHRSGQRYASTTSQVANAASSTATKTKDGASNATSKASQGLSRVTSSAGPALSGAAQGVSNAIGRVGGRTGGLISFVESFIPPTIYYTRVGFELSKIIFRGQKMSPPNLQAFQAYAQPLIRAARNPATLFNQATTSGSATPSSILTRIRDLKPQQMASAGVVAAEMLGFFTVGEMIGKMKIVGYRGGKEHH
ncbi:MAG: hypothetical protein Q9210_001266 [Variospora velana]